MELSQDPNIAAAAPSLGKNVSKCAAVAVITRTLDRPLFLRRALRSVSDQTFQDYIHVIVSDGGDIDQVKKAIEEARIDTSRLLVIDNGKRMGMESASNIGIANSESDYICIHDDDDSWDPNYLECCVAFMKSSRGEKYGGVITHAMYVSEEVIGDDVVPRSRVPYNDWVDRVLISEMSRGNFFAPIQFLFRRSAFTELGGFDESLPVLGDWDFNLRFLLKHDIGLVEKLLANYHHRDRNSTSLYQNSVVASREAHAEYSTIVQNKFARECLRRDSGAFLFHVGHVLGTPTYLRRSRAGQAHMSSVQSFENIQQIADERWTAITHAMSALDKAKQDIARVAKQSDDRWIALNLLLSELNKTEAERYDLSLLLSKMREIEAERDDLAKIIATKKPFKQIVFEELKDKISKLKQREEPQ